MFGYVRVFKPELTFREYEQYRGVYCTLCRTLGKRYGFIPRLTLNYDFAFLALFGMALSDESIRFSKGRCSFCPTKTCVYCHGDASTAIDFVADVSVLLTYHKLEDTIRDERFFRRLSARLLKMFMKRHFRRAVQYRPEQAALACEYMREQWAIEADASASVDSAAHPTAQFLSAIASFFARDEQTKVAVERFGYCLGRFIYLADAAEDMEKDEKEASFNPFLLDNAPCYSALQQVRLDYAAQTLHGSIGVCAEALDGLQLCRFQNIVQNVVYRGMPSVIERIRNPKCKGDFINEKSV